MTTEREKVNKMHTAVILLVEYRLQCQLFHMVMLDSFKLLEQNLLTIAYVFLPCFQYFCLYCFVISSLFFSSVFYLWMSCESHSSRFSILTMLSPLTTFKENLFLWNCNLSIVKCTNMEYIAYFFAFFWHIYLYQAIETIAHETITCSLMSLLRNYYPRD